MTHMSIYGAVNIFKTLKLTKTKEEGLRYKCPFPLGHGRVNLIALPLII